MDVSTMDHYTQEAVDWLISFAPRLLLALVILTLGLWVTKKLLKLGVVALGKAHLGPEIQGFMMSMLSITLKFIVVLIAAGVIGFQVSSLLGVLAGVVFAIGLALQGFLGNFASGITIIFFKPYRVDDWVEISGMFGRVQSIQIFNTILVTPGEKTLIIPNGQVTDNIITNFSTRGRMRLELNVTMPYEESYPKVRKVIEEALQDFPLIMKEPQPLIGIEQFDTHSIIVSVRPYIHPDNYWDATFEAMERIKRAFHDKNIKVAYSEGVELGRIGD